MNEVLSPHDNRSPITRPSDEVVRPAPWFSLLLGALLVLFLGAFFYVVYLFLAWGQTTAAGAPQLPPLELPRLVRAAASTDQQVNEQALTATGVRPARRTNESGPVVSGRVTALLMGVDARPGQKISRTDSIMVLTLNPQTGAAGMLSVARDLLVPLPGSREQVKINTVHVLGDLRSYPGGGPELLRQTLVELLGYPIDYYVRVNFDGFRQIVDLLGGVDIDVLKEINDPTYPDENYGYDPLYIPAGRIHMDGKLALKYARTRHADSDYLRASRQQQVILALKDKVLQPGQLPALLPRVPGLAVAMANSVQTDMPIEKVLALARTLGQIEQQKPTTVVVDNRMGVESLDPSQGFILTPDMNKIRQAAAQVFADAPVQASDAAQRQAIQSEGPKLTVLNGTRQEGLADKVAATLATAGFMVVAQGAADRTDYAQTVLLAHGDRTPVSREALVRRYGLPPDRVRSVPSSSETDLTLILGADQTNAK